MNELKCISNDIPYKPYWCNGVCSSTPCNEFNKKSRLLASSNSWITGGQIKYDPFIMTPTNHMPWSLGLQPNRILDQVRYIMNYFPNYDNPNTYSAGNNRACMFHAHPRLDEELTQMYIGRSDDIITVSMTPVRIRLPDKLLGMFMGYAQDEYGLSPHMLMGLAAKESFATGIYKYKYILISCLWE